MVAPLGMSARHKRVLLVLILAFILIGAAAAYANSDEEETEVEYTPVKSQIVDHTEMFKEANITKYEGSKTCIKCHRDEVYEFFHSYHYQEANKVSDIAGKGTILWGGKYAYNDFCGAIFWLGNKSVNYIGKAVLKAPPKGYENLKGTFIASGCSMCHGVSMGLIPQPNPTEEQLGNIDCLACHADPKVYMAGAPGVKKGFKVVYQDENGTWRYMINPNISIDTIAKSIRNKPLKENCLACHAFSGGGPHYKRPNLSPDLIGNVSKEFDVHMGSGMQCIDCHKVEDHKFPTKAADTWNREGDNVPHCTDCHGEKPHKGLKGWFLNTFHLDKVACQVCHIPVIADGKYPTDMYRDWSQAEFIPEGAKYEPKLDLEKNVTPVYMWYNGTRQVYIYPEPVTPDENNEIIYVKPLGSKDDPNSKIYPFKLHYAVVPYSKTNKTIVPIKVGIVFATGNVTKAVQAGASIAGLKWDGGWVTLVRYMQVDHGVKPADEALSCFNCHGPTVRRMPWPELGYGHYPEIAFITLTAVTVAVIIILAYKLLIARYIRK
ncbi:MAG: hypothetical protein F7C35_03900 [Desulfurococcales archaeon]|nr:hypothetical protein [Desulfurococcales archaeon]